MCKCGEKTVEKGCKENVEAVVVESEQKTKSDCTGDQHKSGGCCSAKAD